jgi:hypothetical protein
VKNGANKAAGDNQDFDLNAAAFISAPRDEVFLRVT